MQSTIILLSSELSRNNFFCFETTASISSVPFIFSRASRASLELAHKSRIDSSNAPSFSKSLNLPFIICGHVEGLGLPARSLRIFPKERACVEDKLNGTSISNHFLRLIMLFGFRFALLIHSVESKVFFSSSTISNLSNSANIGASLANLLQTGWIP